MPSDFNPNNVWGSNAALAGEEELTTPSGQTCRAKRFDITDLISAGVLDQADSLTALVQGHLTNVGKGGAQEVDPMSLLQDPNALRSMMSLLDKSMPHIVVSPKVLTHFNEITVGKTKVQKPLNEDQRAEMLATFPGAIFTDQIDFNDRMWLFNWATGGLQAMATFRDGSPAAVAGVVHGGKAKAKAKRVRRGR